MILPFRFTLPGGYGDAAAELCKELVGPRVRFASDSKTVVEAPLTSAWLLWQTLGERAWPVLEVSDPWTNKQPPIDFTPWSTAQAEAGRTLLAPLVDQGILRDHIPDWGKSLLTGMTPYQLSATAWSQHRPYLLAIWACGAGKTVGTLLPGLHRLALLQDERAPGSLVIVGPAKTRRVWRNQVRQYTHLETCVILPESEQRASYEAPRAYYERCRAEKQLPVFMLGQESLADHWKEVMPLRPQVLLFDELHLLRNHKRWSATAGADGRREISLNNNRAAAAYQLTNLPTVQMRIGASATPLGTGKPRDLYAPLTLLAPGDLGGYWDYASRFCDAHETPEGWMDDSGSARLEELRQRTMFFRHEVSHKDSHGQLPPLRWEMRELTQDEVLSRPVSRRELEKELGQEEGLSGPTLKIELEIALCSSLKLPVVTEDALEAIQSGEKVVSFWPRRLVCEKAGERARKALEKAGLPDVPLFIGHGGTSQRARDQMLDDFIKYPGPCWLVGTGEAWGTGVDGLHCAGLGQIAMLPWTPELFEQWRGRFDRHGSKGTLVRIYVGPTGSVDSRILPRLIEEIGVIEQFMRADALDGARMRLRGRDDAAAFQKKIMNWALSSDTSDADLPEG